MTKSRKKKQALRERQQGDLNQWLGLQPAAVDQSQLTQAETLGSSTADQIKLLEDKMAELGISQVAFQREVMKRLDQMAPSHNQRQHNPPTPFPVEQTRNDAENLAQLFYEGSKQQAFMQAHSLLKPLREDEGLSRIQSYFQTFESMTRNWSSQRQADLLVPHLEDQARQAYESLGPSQRRDYDTIKESILHSNANSSSYRTEAQMELKNIYQKADKASETLGSESSS